jgi:acetyl esterase/lipase
LAKWLNTQGYSALVLLYRLPTSPDLIDPELGPIQDAQRAMKLIRSRASDWNLDTARLGVMGASAGGHLAAHLSTARRDWARIGDALDTLGVHPAFQILISPVISMGEYTHQGSKRNLLGDVPSANLVKAYSMEHQVQASTPPAWLIHVHNDEAVSPQISLLYYQALWQAGVSASLHIFPQGGHAIGVTRNPGSTRWWTEICAAWLAEMELADP